MLQTEETYAILHEMGYTVYINQSMPVDIILAKKTRKIIAYDLVCLTRFVHDYYNF